MGVLPNRNAPAVRSPQPSRIRKIPSPSGERRVQAGVLNPAQPMNSFWQIFSWRRQAIGLIAGAVVGAGFVSEAAGARARQVSARSLARGFSTDAMAVGEFRPAERAFLGKAVETS